MERCRLSGRRSQQAKSGEIQRAYCGPWTALDVFQAFVETDDCIREGSLHGLFLRPWLAPPERVLEQIETAEVDSDVLRLSGEDVGEWVLDKQTHLPISQKSMDDNSSFGRLTYYRLPTVYPGEVTAPAIRLQVDIRDGIAHNAKVTAIVDAEFNLDIPRSAFVVPVPKGAVMVDERSDERHARRLKHDIDDAAEYFFANGVPQTDQVASSSGQSQKKFDWKAFFLIANGISLIVLGVVLWRRSGS